MIIYQLVMKRILGCLLFVFLSFAHSQDVQKHIQKLKNELETNTNAHRKTQLYNDLTWDYIDVSLDSALVYGAKALEFAKKPQILN